MLKWVSYKGIYFIWYFDITLLGYLENLFGSTFFVPLYKATEIVFESKSSNPKILPEYLKIIHDSIKSNAYADLSSLEKYLK